MVLEKGMIELEESGETWQDRARDMTVSWPIKRE